MNATTAGAVWLVVQCIWSPTQETSCQFVHVKDRTVLLQSKEWRAGHEVDLRFDTEDECRARSKLLANQQQPDREVRRKLEAKGYGYSFWCIPYARDALPEEFAKEPPLYKPPQPPPNLSSGPPSIQPPWHLNESAPSAE
jgi:hypothetical protein